MANNLWQTDDPQIALARTRLVNAAQKYEELMGRVDAARMELDIARTEFKYRFTVIHPAEVPRMARKPNLLALLPGGLAVVLLFFLLVPAGVDFARGRFIEAWQVNRRLRLPVLAELPWQD